MVTAVVGLIMGSHSDWPVVEQAAAILEKFGVPWEATVASAHRTPERAAVWAATAEQRGIRVIIAAAGLAAHLPGVVAAQTSLPVIGLPVGAGALTGVDALYSIVQMPPGVPVATVGIDAGRNAGLLAVQIAAVADPQLREKLLEYKQELAAEAIAADKRLQEEVSVHRAAAWAASTQGTGYELDSKKGGQAAREHGGVLPDEDGPGAEMPDGSRASAGPNAPDVSGLPADARHTSRGDKHD